MLKNLLLIVAICILNKSAFGIDMTKYEELVTKVLPNNRYFVSQFDDYVKKLLKIEPNYFDYSPLSKAPFTCQKETNTAVPTSVHQLRPQDIKVVAALGDSLTAGLGAGASSVAGLLIEHRGVSFSMGGDNTVDKTVSLPNLIRAFNPNVIGFNTGTVAMSLAKQGVGFNVAVSGQEANHMPAQAQLLVDRIKQHAQVNVNNDWKMITLFIGGNDLCDYCKNKSLHSPERYIADIQTALDILYNNLPRTFVNLVTVLRVNEVKELNLNLVCRALHSSACPCASNPESVQEEHELIAAQNQYQKSVETLVNSGRYDGKNDFTVVVQPFFKDFSIPKLENGDVDISFFAPDCFHLSLKGHSYAATGLWNNLLQPVGKKSTAAKPEDVLNCPDKSFPYFYTTKNHL